MLDFLVIISGSLSHLRKHPRMYHITYTQAPRNVENISSYYDLIKEVCEDGLHVV